MKEPISEKFDPHFDTKTKLDESNLRNVQQKGHDTYNVLPKLAVGCLLFLDSCTYSITMVHTQGEATDVVDETQSNTPNVSPNVSIPATAI